MIRDTFGVANMRVVKRKGLKVTRGSKLLRELRQAVQTSGSDLVGKPVEEVVKVTRRLREKLWRERASESSSTRTSSSSR
jgi:hypothetical protein